MREKYDSKVFKREKQFNFVLLKLLILFPIITRFKGGDGEDARENMKYYECVFHVKEVIMWIVGKKVHTYLSLELEYELLI